MASTNWFSATLTFKRYASVSGMISKTETACSITKTNKTITFRSFTSWPKGLNSYTTCNSITQEVTQHEIQDPIELTVSYTCCIEHSFCPETIIRKWNAIS